MRYANHVPTPESASRTAPLWARLLVLAVILFALFFQLGRRALNEPDEGRYSEVGREMLATGDWLTPRVNGILHISKPPLTYWCIGASLKIFGVNETAARLPAALAALGTLVALYLLVRDASNETTALWSVLMLTSSALFFLIARLITADMLLTCWVTWSVWAIWRRSNWLFVFLALGMLTKGPVAVALPLFAIIGLRPPLRAFRWGWGLLLFVVLSASWFVVMAIRQPELWRYFFVREIFQRVATAEHGRAQPWWFLIVVTLGGALPWTLLIFSRNISGTFTDPARRMFIAFISLGVVLFSLSQSKLPTYVLPLMPAVAALAAMSPPRRWLNAFAALTLVAALSGLAYYLRSRCGLSNNAALALNIIAGIGALAAIVAALLNRATMFRCLCVATFLGVVSGVVAMLPTMERNLRHNTSTKFFAERIRREDPRGTTLVICHECLPPTFPFYMQRNVWSYNPNATTNRHVYEFHFPPPGTPFIVSDAAEHRRMLTDGRRVFCVASANKAEKMREITGADWHVLERAGQGVLLSNQP